MHSHPPSNIPLEESNVSETSGSGNNQNAGQASGKQKGVPSRFTVTPAAIGSTTLPLPPTSEYVDVEHRVCISFLVLKLFHVLFILPLQVLIADFQKLSAAPALNYSPSTVSTDSKTSVPGTPSAKTRFQVQAVPNPPPATVTAQQANTVEKKATPSNAATNHSNVGQARPQQMPVGTSSVTLEQLDSELRKVSGVQTDVASVVATGSPHLMHALSQSLSSANVPNSQQHQNQIQAEPHNQLADLNEKLALLTNKQHHHSDHAESSQPQQNPHRTVNALSRSGSVVPEDFGQSSASIANSAAGTASPSMSSSTILHSNMPLESLNDLASALQRVGF